MQNAGLSLKGVSDQGFSIFDGPDDKTIDDRDHCTSFNSISTAAGSKRPSERLSGTFLSEILFQTSFNPVTRAARERVKIVARVSSPSERGRAEREVRISSPPSALVSRVRFIADLKNCRALPKLLQFFRKGKQHAHLCKTLL
jgi:hypothetical protein